MLPSHTHYDLLEVPANAPAERLFLISRLGRVAARQMGFDEELARVQAEGIH